MTPEEKKLARQAAVKKYNEKNREKQRLYYQEIKEKIKEKNEQKKEQIRQYNVSYYEQNKEREKNRVKQFRLNNPDYVKKYYEQNKEKRNNWYNEKRKNDSLFRLKTNIKASIKNSFKRNSYKKISKTELILGCTYEEFKQHIESLWEPWMNWDNYGLYNGELNYGWDIDHIIPTSSAATEEELIKLNHYTNLQPLCSKVNRDIKKNKAD